MSEGDDAVAEGCRGGSGEYHARPGDPVRCLTRLLKIGEAGNIRDSLLLNQVPAILIVVFAFLVCWGRVPLTLPCSCVYYIATLYPSLTIFVGPLSASFSSSTKLAAAQLELQAWNAPGSQRT